MALFPPFFLWNIGHQNVFYGILEQKKPFLGYKNMKFKKLKNWHFCIFAWFWSKNGPFSNFYCLCNIGQENVFYHIVKQKYPFLGYKNMKFKKSKSWHFSKGVNPWFWSKNDPFSNFFFLKYYSLGKCLLRYSRTKKRFLNHKNQKFKKSKNWHFSKGVNPWFGSKNGPFFNFFFV